MLVNKASEVQVLRGWENVFGVCVRVCVFFPFILDIKFAGRTSRGHTGGRSHRISHPPSFCGACLNFSREKGSAIPSLVILYSCLYFFPILDLNQNERRAPNRRKASLLTLYI